MKMRGGMKVYAGSAAAARAYLEADCGRADDYYLTEGTGLARRFVARDGRVAERAPLKGRPTKPGWPAAGPDTGNRRRTGATGAVGVTSRWVVDVVLTVLVSGCGDYDAIRAGCATSSAELERVASRAMEPSER